MWQVREDQCDRVCLRGGYISVLLVWFCSIIFEFACSLLFYFILFFDVSITRWRINVTLRYMERQGGRNQWGISF